MRGTTTNFISNAFGQGSVPVFISAAHGWTNADAGPKDPEVHLQITQNPPHRGTMNPKRYTVIMSPDEARDLAKRLIKNADDVEAACKTTPNKGEHSGP